jgi:hypothetical protein
MRKKQEVIIKRFCRDCAHARDFHSMSLLNEPILCKCDFQRYSMLLNHDFCEHFKNKT